jgi:hypothetical protein
MLELMTPPIKKQLFSGAVIGVLAGALWLALMAGSAAIDICGVILTAFCLGAFLFRRKKIVVRHLNALPPHVHLHVSGH